MRPLLIYLNIFFFCIEGNKDRNTNGSHSLKNRMSNGLSSVSKVDDTDASLFHDDDISRAASGSRKNR